MFYSFFSNDTKHWFFGSFQKIREKKFSSIMREKTLDYFKNRQWEYLRFFLCQGLTLTFEITQQNSNKSSNHLKNFYPSNFSFQFFLFVVSFVAKSSAKYNKLSTCFFDKEFCSNMDSRLNFCVYLQIFHCFFFFILLRKNLDHL